MILAGAGLGGLLGPAFHRYQDRRLRFVEGFLSGSLVMAVGPLAVLGALEDGIGQDIQLLTTKSIIDFFIALALATSLGWGVAMAAVPVLAIQGSFTVIGLALGEVLPEAHMAALTATGGILLGGAALRVLKLKEFPTGDLLPALAVAPVLTELMRIL